MSSSTMLGGDFWRFCVVAVGRGTFWFCPSMDFCGISLCVCISTDFSCNLFVILEYICDNWWIAAIWSSPMLEYGVDGAGCFSAYASSIAALVAFSGDKWNGRDVLCGKNSTPSESLSPLVLVM